MSSGTPMDPDTRRGLRDAFGRFATGVTVVATRQADGTPRGFTANSFTSVSLDPPLLLVCIAKAALSCDSFAVADHFTVNILADDQKEISGLFASRSADKFAIAQWHSDAHDMPVIDGALASFSCARHQIVEAGDHLILIGRVEDFETRDGAPLGYFRGAYFDIGLDRAVTEAATSRGATIGAVLAQKDQLLLACGPDGRITLPSADNVNALTHALQADGMTPELAHLYAVYRHSRTGAQRIVYHGHVTGAPPEGYGLFDLGAMPLDRVEDRAERSLLQRYTRENQHGAFGIYHGTDIQGVVHSLAGHHIYHI